eukprot:12401954-Karenia_brevis.AAC.1
MSSCDKSGQWFCTAPVFHEMRRGGLSLEVISFNTAMSSSENVGQWPSRGVSLNVISFNAAISDE